MNDTLPAVEEMEKNDAAYKAQSLHKVRIPSYIVRVALGVGISIPLSCIALILVPWQQVSMGRGKVVAYAPENRRQSVEAPVDGKISQWKVREGQAVKAGQTLVELSDIDPNIISRLKSQRDALKINLEASEKALEISKKNLVRQKKLAEDGLSSERAYELAVIEAAKFESEVSKVRAQLASMEVKVSRQQSQSVIADQDGIVMRILVPQGGVLVKAGEELAMLVPDTNDRAVEMYISGNDLPLVQPGRKVRLQFEGWPAVQFTGWPSVAIGTFGGVVQYVDHADDGEGNYRVLVFPDNEDIEWPNQQFLRQGIRTVGWILLDEVRLGWELWRQLNGFPVTVDGDTLTQGQKVQGIAKKKIK